MRLDKGVQSIPADNVTRLEASQAIVGESPRWLSRHNCLIYMDIIGKEFRRFDPSNGAESRWPLEQVTGCCIETSDPNKVMLAQQDRLSLFDLEAETLTKWQSFETGNRETRGNDGRVAPDGKFWISTMNMMREPRPPEGNLYSVAPGGEMVKHMGGYCIPNALAFSPDGGRMYFADSITRAVWQFDRDADTGALSNQRMFFEFGPDEPGIPDGASVDTDGCYWVGVAQGGARVERRRPDGTLDTVIRMPADNVTMCSFGGPNRDQLFITTLSKHLPEEERANHPEQGALYVIETGHQGLPETPFPLTR